jgi:heme-degrading monooxygenase HmoA
MFIHAVLFEIKPKEVKDYRKDSIMWANFAKKESKGFISYFTMKRVGEKNQYVSVYKWKTRDHHNTFMKKFHDFLVSKSKAKVKTLGYYNLKAIDQA